MEMHLTKKAIILIIIAVLLRVGLISNARSERLISQLKYI